MSVGLEKLVYDDYISCPQRQETISVTVSNKLEITPVALFKENRETHDEHESESEIYSNCSNGILENQF